MEKKKKKQYRLKICVVLVVCTWCKYLDIFGFFLDSHTYTRISIPKVCVDVSGLELEVKKKKKRRKTTRRRHRCNIVTFVLGSVDHFYACTFSLVQIMYKTCQPWHRFPSLAFCSFFFFFF